jgi:tetratricopeptide (TPR) repeat protein
MRLFDRAIEDLNQANSLMPGFPLELEPDGIPNAINKPLSSTQFNIRYHLGLAHYLKGEFANAEQAYIECLKTCDNDDLMVACVDWLYMTYRRQGKTDLAASILGNVHEGMNIVENDSYYKRCLMYQGKLPPDSVLQVSDADPEQASLALATQGYGVGNWYLYNGDTAKAKSIFEQVVAGEHFGAFGFIAAEAELFRWKK